MSQDREVLLSLLSKAEQDIQKAYEAGKSVGYLEGIMHRELTDEEIIEIYKKIHGWDVKLGDKNWIELAREFLRKAHE